MSAAGDAILYATYLGGSQSDEAYGVALDAAGNTYTTGATSSNEFPTTPGAFQTVRGDATQGVGSDVFVAKLNTAASGAPSLLYSTFVGGDSGDTGNDIVLDPAGNVYVAGQTFSPNYPVTPNAFQTAFGGGLISGSARADAFATKLDINQPGAAALLYSTYLGGTNAGDVAYGVAVGTTGDIYLTGRTDSSDFPITCTGVPAQNQGGPFITRIDPSTPGASGLVYSSYFSGSSGADVAFAVALDAAANVYLAGSAFSPDFPSTPGGYRNPTGASGTEAFVSKLDQVRRFNCSCPNDPAGDADADGVCGSVDNCPSNANPNQEDSDGDGIGDACDTCPLDPANDADGDGVCGNADNCPTTFNPGQEDSDGDGVGDACDNCRTNPNANQADTDGDGDGVPDCLDNCQTTFNPDQQDSNHDGVGDACAPFQFPSGGMFVVGNLANLSVGATVNFWGSQWSQHNPLSGGAAPSAFKGFEDGTATPACGGTWTSRPGNGSNPPPVIPQFMGVIVSSRVTKSGSSVTGDVKRIVVVQTNSGYGPSPGHWGTGQVVAVICGAP